jgi:hypothetical protein
MTSVDSIITSNLTDVSAYKELCLRGSELAEFMSCHKNELFYGRAFSASSISNLACRGAIPSKQMYLEGKEAIKKVKMPHTYDVYEIIRWCRLGADRTACIQVLKERRG